MGNRAISESIPKIDHREKIRGEAKYLCDLPADGVLHGRALRSSIASGEVLEVRLPPLPEGYWYIDSGDVPCRNEVHIVLDDTPVFADKNVSYIGDPIGMILGPDEKEADRLLREIEVVYEMAEPVFDARASKVEFFEYKYEKGDVVEVFRSADKVFRGSYETGLQEHMYLETNSVMAAYEGGTMTVRGSVQCPYYVHKAVAAAMGFEKDKVRVIQDVMGGSFGGKEDYPSVIACQAAVAAYKTGRPVRVMLDRREDVKATGKRHPSFCDYEVAVKNGRVVGMKAELLYDAGAYTTLTPVVLQRGAIGACGVYEIPNLKVRGTARKTNTVPNGAFRGFGGPQAFFSVEMMMTHVAMELGIDPVEFKLAHVTKQGDATSTGGKYHFPVPIPDMARQALHASDYHAKTKAYAGDTGRYRRGMGFSAVYHGAGFTGNGERDIIKAVVKLHKRCDGTVEILTANTDMGQGLPTAFLKIAACELELPFDRIIINNPDTAAVPDSGPTVASRSLMVVGELLRRAAARLKSEWADGEEQIIREEYKHPEFLVPFDTERFYGDAYPTYSWAVNVAEVEVDTLTGLISLVGAWGCFDVGTPIDENIVIGQMEGGLLQSIGYGMMEKMTAPDGRIRNDSFSEYIIPTSLDVPNLNVMLHVEEYPEGPYGAKGAGELPHVGGAPAVVEAIQNALHIPLSKAPFLPEDVLRALRAANTGQGGPAAPKTGSARLGGEQSCTKG